MNDACINPNKKRKISIVFNFDDLITNILNIKNLKPIVTVYVCGRKSSIIQSYFTVPENVRFLFYGDRDAIFVFFLVYERIFVLIFQVDSQNFQYLI